MRSSSILFFHFVCACVFPSFCLFIPFPGSPLPSSPYWFDPRIHVLGNDGVWGGIHAAVAPAVTRLIDVTAYGGKDIRSDLLDSIPSSWSVVDFCCGTGSSTRRGGKGVDTSPQMVGMAKLVCPGSSFEVGNAEEWGETKSYDVSTIMFGMHEMPEEGRRRVLENASRVARKYVVVVDIDSSYSPSESMLSGEPFVLDYLSKVEEELSSSLKVPLVQDRASAWILRL